MSQYSTKKRALQNTMDLHAFFVDGVVRKVDAGVSHQTVQGTAVRGSKCGYCERVCRCGPECGFGGRTLRERIRSFMSKRDAFMFACVARDGFTRMKRRVTH